MARCPISPHCSCAAASARSPRRPPRCADCRRTPLAGERMHELDAGRVLCELCFARASGGPPPRRAQRARARERAPALGRARRPPEPPAPRRGSGTMARRMREVTVSTVISAPREEVFDFVSDLAGRPAYTDHYMRRLPAGPRQPVGEGAAARFRLQPPARSSEYAELTITESDRPRRIVEEIARGAARPQPLPGGLRLHAASRAARHAGGADHLRRAGHVRRPDQGDRRRRLDPPADARSRSSGCA